MPELTPESVEVVRLLWEDAVEELADDPYAVGGPSDVRSWVEDLERVAGELGWDLWVFAAAPESRVTKFELDRLREIVGNG